MFDLALTFSRYVAFRENFHLNGLQIPHLQMVGGDIERLWGAYPVVFFSFSWITESQLFVGVNLLVFIGLIVIDLNQQ